MPRLTAAAKPAALRAGLFLLVFVLSLSGCANRNTNTPGGTPVVLPTRGQDPVVSTVMPTPTTGISTTAGGFTVMTTPVQFILAQVTMNIRQGPSTDHAIVGQVAAGMIAQVTGINPEATWWQVICPDGSVGDCWVSADPTLTSEVGGTLPVDAPVDALPDAAPIHETGDAVVESIRVRTLESLPVQYQAVISGYLPDSCTTITGVQQVRESTTFRIRMSTRRAADAACAQALVPFEETITLDVGGLPAGAYQVAVNALWTSFELTGSEAGRPVYPVIETPVSHIIARSEVNIFAGPGSQFTRLGVVAAGMTALVTGSSPDGQWWRVICPDSTIGDCWLSADQALTESVTATPAPATTPEE